MTIRKASCSDQDIRAAAWLALLLWPHSTLLEMETDMEGFLQQEEAAIFLAEEDGAAVGFAQVGLRHDYVEGADYSPTGYLEGIYVMEAYRNKGFARELLATCEDWARDMNCRQFASDCELSNSGSLVFHLKNGFREANRIICFLKYL